MVSGLGWFGKRMQVGEPSIVFTACVSKFVTTEVKSRNGLLLRRDMQISRRSRVPGLWWRYPQENPWPVAPAFAGVQKLFGRRARDSIRRFGSLDFRFRTNDGWFAWVVATPAYETGHA